MNVETTAFLVGEKGFALETTPKIIAGLIAIGEIGDQVGRVFIAAAPPADQIQGYYG